MEIVSAIISFILIISSIIGLFWLMLGVPAGLVLIILKANHKVKLTTKQILLCMFGGLGLMVISFVFFFILSVILGFFGIPLSQINLPQQ